MSKTPSRGQQNNEGVHQEVVRDPDLSVPFNDWLPLNESDTPLTSEAKPLVESGFQKVREELAEIEGFHSRDTAVVEEKSK
jgi:hypothetical protein